MKGMLMPQPILRFANKADLNELYDVYLKNYPGLPTYSFKDLSEYVESISDSVLIGLVDNKIVAHLFCHPIIPNDYEDAINWYKAKYFNPNGTHLYIWGAGILKEFRTKYNFTWTVQNKQFEHNLNKYKTIKNSILCTINERKLYGWHLLAGYTPQYVINNVFMESQMRHLIVLEFELRKHIETYGYDKLKRYYGYVNSGIIPEFIER